MIKVIAGAIRHPTNRSLEDFQRYWSEKHGPLFARTPELRRYVQNITLTEACAGAPAPTHDGASMFWYDDLEVLAHPSDSPHLAEVVRPSDGDLFDWYVRSDRYGPAESLTLREAVRADDQQLFDRSSEWPLSSRRISVVAAERVVVDGDTTPDMIKSVTAVLRMPGLSLEDFGRHWFDVHGPLCAKVPGVRRYVQNHAVSEAYAVRGMTHDGWAELWFDDIEAMQRARESQEWQVLGEDGRSLFARPLSSVIAREQIQKG